MHLSILTSVLLAATALAAPIVSSAGDALANSDDQIVTPAIYGGVASPDAEPMARRGDEDNTLARAFENANCKSHNSNTSAPIRQWLTPLPSRQRCVLVHPLDQDGRRTLGRQVLELSVSCAQLHSTSSLTDPHSNKISSLSFISDEDKVKNNRFSCSWH
jgi:hypothetical protein